MNILFGAIILIVSLYYWKTSLKILAAGVGLAIIAGISEQSSKGGSSILAVVLIMFLLVMVAKAYRRALGPDLYKKMHDEDFSEVGDFLKAREHSERGDDSETSNKDESSTSDLNASQKQNQVNNEVDAEMKADIKSVDPEASNKDESSTSDLNASQKQEQVNNKADAEMKEKTKFNEDNYKYQEELRLYNELIPHIMSLCIVSDGKIESDETNAAISLIRHDDFIFNKEETEKELRKHIEEIMKASNNVDSVIEMKFITLETALKDLKSDQQIKKVTVILKALTTAVEEEGKKSTQAVANRIRHAILSNRRKRLMKIAVMLIVIGIVSMIIADTAGTLDQLITIPNSGR